MKLLAFRRERLCTRGGDPEGPLRKDLSVHLSPSYFCALNTKPLGLGVGSKIRAPEIEQVRQIHSFPFVVKVPGELNQDLDVNVLGQHGCEDVFQ